MRHWALALAGAGVLCATSISAIAADQYSFVVSSPGGTMFRLGAGLTEVFNKNQDVAKFSTVPGGGAANPASVGSGQGEVGFSFSNFATAAYNGTAPFDEEYKDLRHVAAFWGSCYHQYIARELYDSGIKTWEDAIASKEPLAMGAGPAGTSTDAINRMVLEHLGTSFEELEGRGYKFTYTGMSATSEQISSGQVDMYFHNSGDPNAAGVQASIGRELTFMGLSDNLKATLGERGFSECVIPGGVYENIAEDHASMGAKGVLMAHKDLDAEVVYSLMKITHENIAELGNVHKIFKSWTPEFGAFKYDVPLHPGAEKFYREVGVLN